MIGSSRMPPLLRRYLIACNAITFAYLLWHAIEPLRLNVGDPWADAELVFSVTHRGVPSANSSVVPLSSLSAIVYGALAKLGLGDIAMFRLVALAISGLGTWALFQYLRRTWSESVAWLGTSLFTTSLLSLEHADSLQSFPIEHAACFAALWGLVRALETEKLRHYAVATAGMFTSIYAGADDWLFLSAGALVTILAKRGDPFARGNFRFVAVCIVGAIGGAWTRPALILTAAEWPKPLDDGLVVPLVPLLTTTLSPALWISVVCAAWRALRLQSLRAAVDDAMSWLVVVALLLVIVSSLRPGPPMLRAVSVLPFFAAGTAIALERMIAAERARRSLGVAWMVLATLWGPVVALRHTRAVLGRDDTTTVRDYLAHNDGNDFVVSNLLDDGVIRAAFDRQSWSVIAENDNATANPARMNLLQAFAAAGTDHIHAVVFTQPASRMIDRSLGQLAKYRGLGPTIMWPEVHASRAESVVRAYDAKLRELLEVTGARRVLHFADFDVFRIDRATLLERMGQSVPMQRELHMNSPAAGRFKLLGWRGPGISEVHRVGVSAIAGYPVCANPVRPLRPGEPAQSACETTTSQSELRVRDVRGVDAAQLMVRMNRACDLRIRAEVEPVTWRFLADWTAPVLALSAGDFAASQCAESGEVSFVVPQAFVHEGINVLSFATRSLGPFSPRADIKSLVIEPACESQQ
jgi:hypothetical protein